MFGYAFFTNVKEILAKLSFLVCYMATLLGSNSYLCNQLREAHIEQLIYFLLLPIVMLWRRD
jgi:hypothetical protein